MKQILLLILAFISLHLRAQFIESEQCFGGNEDDSIVYIKPVNDGGKIFIVQSNSTNGTFGTPSHGMDVVLMKLDSYNEVQWQTSIDDTLGDDQFNSIYLFENNIYVVTNNMMMTSLDMDGHIRWKLHYNYNAIPEINFEIKGDTIFHDIYLYYTKDYTMHLLKIKSDGQVLYNKVYNFDGYIQAYYNTSLISSISVMPDKSLVLVNLFSSMGVIGSYGKVVVTKIDTAGNEIARVDTAAAGDFLLFFMPALTWQTSDSIHVFTPIGFVEVSVNKQDLGYRVTQSTDGLLFPMILDLVQQPAEFWKTGSNAHEEELYKMGYMLSETTLDSTHGNRVVIIIRNFLNDTRDTIFGRDSLGTVSFYFDPIDSSLYFIRGQHYDSSVYFMKSTLHGHVIFDKPVLTNASGDFMFMQMFFGNLSHGKIIQNYWEPTQIMQILDTQTGDVDFEYRNNYTDARWYKYVDVLPGDRLVAFANLDGSQTCRLGGTDILKQIIRMHPNAVLGAAYIDNNNNNQYDGADAIYNLAMLESKKGNKSVSNFMYGSVFTKNNVDTGTWVTKLNMPNNYFTSVPAFKTTSHTEYGFYDTTIFALHPVAQVYDLNINLVNTFITRLGGRTTYEMTYSNNGTQTQDGEVKLFWDQRLYFIESSPVSLLDGDTLKWQFSNLKPGEFRKISVIVNAKTPPVLNIGDQLSSVAWVNGTHADTTPSDNQSILKETILGSYDPNDKVSTNGDDMTTTQIQNGDYITYVVRFQNTGNDTAFKVVILDTLSANVDGSSFQMVDASHNFSVQLINNTILQFTSNNIQLPPLSINEGASHGFVAYKVKPKSTLYPGDTIKNTAHIYFDYNPPVSTSTVNTRITLLTSIHPDIKNDLLKIYPNPNSGIFSVGYAGNEALRFISITDITGREVYHKNISSSEKNISVDLHDAAGGLYTISLKTEAAQYVQKILLTQEP